VVTPVLVVVTVGQGHTPVGEQGNKMTEAEWLSCSDPAAMLNALPASTASARKFRLFACACCRRHQGVLKGKKNARVLGALEDFADGNIPAVELDAARREWYTFDYPFPRAGTWQMALACATSTRLVAFEVAVQTSDHTVRAARNPAKESAVQAGFVRDIFGHPHRPVNVDPSWLTPTVLALAAALYPERAFDRLPILADALEEAGCDDAEVLAHYRGDGPHVRGCWVIDLVLGKE
jgi:hypothetical protein